MLGNKLTKAVWSNPVHIMAFGFGAGLSPKAPGTVGTLVALPLYLVVMNFSLLAYLSVVVVMLLLGVWLCHVTASNLGVHDHPGIVWDEIVGFLITMIAAPKGWFWIGLGFALFRLFDIWKPWPIRWADTRVAGGVGIMLDDIIAGIYAAAVLAMCSVLAGVTTF